MKISIKAFKLLFLFSTFAFALSIELKKEMEKTPVYEIPFIKKRDSPVSNNYNPRIENINLSSQEKVNVIYYNRILEKNIMKLKTLLEQI